MFTLPVAALYVSIDPNEQVNELIAQARLALASDISALVTPDGKLLPLQATLKEAGATNNSDLCAIVVRKMQLYCNKRCFAALKGNGSLEN